MAMGVLALSRRFVQKHQRTAAILLAVVVCYMLIMFPLGCGRMLADELMLFPSTDPLDSLGATERFVETPSGRMQVWVARSSEVKPERFVLRLEGNGGRAEFAATPIALRWSERPTEVWAMNHPGFGKSEGPAALDRLAPAALSVFDAMAAEAAGRPVYVDADSMGCTLALHIATERPEVVGGLVLKNPPPLRELVMGRFGWWNLWLAAWPVARAIPAELDAISNARRSEMPAVIISARLDTLVPGRYQQRIIDAYAGRSRVVWFEDAEHNTPLDEATNGRIVEAVDWLVARNED